MNIKHCLLLLLLTVAQTASAQNQWAWMSGDKSAGARGVYGTQGVAAASNTPGSRVGASSWTDKDGNLWLFGGQGDGESSGTRPLNDLWKYNLSIHQWTWMGGDKNGDTPGSYGDRIVSSPENQPGARQNAVCWTDNQGNFWMFGGKGLGSQESSGLLNDLWKYSSSTNQWTWVSGTDHIDEKGKYGKRNEASQSNYPGGRYMAAGFKDPDGNLWLFGGSGYSSKSQISDLNDVWKYSPATDTWAWMNGDKSQRAKDHYGKKGVFAEENTPGGRQGSTGWTDKSGNFWLYGGGTGWNVFNDLWKYDRASNRWAFMNGNKNFNHQPVYTEKGVPDPDGNPGSRMLGAGLTDGRGNLWLFGGSGYGGLLVGANSLNSLWKYSINTDEWTFVSGETSILPTAVYGSQGVPATENRPGGMANSASWIDKHGDFWIFGGQSLAGDLNQSWKLSLDCDLPIVGTLDPATASICEGGSVLLTASGGTEYEWRLNGLIILQNADSTLAATEPGNYSVLIKNGQCIAPALLLAVVTLGTSPIGTITPTTATFCEGDTQVLTATGGTSYEWLRNGVIIGGQSLPHFNATDSGTYSVNIRNGSCTGPAMNTAVITTIPSPKGTISPANASICEGGSQVLTATGGIAYQWKKDGITMDGETGATLTVTTAGTYSVLISNGICDAEASNNGVVTIIAPIGTRYADVTVAANTPTQLSGRPNGISYEWTPVTGLDNASSATPVVTTNTETQYLVRIGVSADCFVTDTVLVKIASTTPIPTPTQQKIFVPTAFTPNGNNVNDRLRPLGKLGSIDYFKVLNRWGNVVFQTNEAGKGWDGRYNGIEQPSDVYTWILSGKMTDGQVVKQSGKTLLIR